MKTVSFGNGIWRTKAAVDTTVMSPGAIWLNVQKIPFREQTPGRWHSSYDTIDYGKGYLA
jgi:hypothetical protein